MRLKLHEYKGEQLTVEQIAEREGVTPNAICKRLKKTGQARLRPYFRKVYKSYKSYEWTQDPSPKLHEYEGEQLTIKQIAEREGVTPQAIKARLRNTGVPYIRPYPTNDSLSKS